MRRDLLHCGWQKVRYVPMRRTRWLLICAVLGALCSVPSFAQEQSLPPAHSTDLALQDMLTADEVPQASSSTIRDQVVAFYRARDYQPVWTGSADARSRASLVRETLRHADSHGLVPKDYAIRALKSDGADAARYEIALTTALLHYASDVHTGRFKPQDVYSDAKLPDRTFDAAALLNRALTEDALDLYLASLPPTGTQYRTLVAALARYRAILKDGGWAATTLHARDQLVKRLALEDPEFAVIENPADEDLHAALARYQSRNGLDADGTLDTETLVSLNVPVSTRIAQIEANLERLRWMPVKLERRYVSVNVPDQSVDFVRKGKVVLHSKVVVGRPELPTPILRTEVKAIVANPPWDLSDPIAAELLPHLRKDPDYLEKKGIILVDGPADDPYGRNIDWNKVTPTTIPYQLQQKPGPGNALGTLMLDMPNDFDVYLHDTSNKEFFDLQVREKSHGCVRVQQIYPLASLILTDDIDDGMEKLKDAVATGETERLPLDDPMPVYLVYWTALPQDDGTVGFRPDRYGRDKKLTQMLQSSGTPVASADTNNPLKLSLSN